MSILYVPFDGVHVSKRWAVVLHQAREEGVIFHINSGHRTMREQWKLYRQNMSGGRPRPGRPLTAIPSPLAPHIRTGSPAHALDVNSLDGGETRLQRWLEKKGTHPTNPVRGESWHMELSRAELTRLWRRYRTVPTVQRTSSKGREFLAREEGLRLYAYNDSAGHATFGVGHLIHHGPVTAADRRKWGSQSAPRTRAYAMSLFKQDLKAYEKAVRKAVGRRLPQRQFDACVSLCFNIGAGGFTDSTVARVLRTGDPSNRAHLAADAFLMWDKPSELRPRREREKRLFLDGRYR